MREVTQAQTIKCYGYPSVCIQTSNLLWDELEIEAEASKLEAGLLEDDLGGKDIEV